MMALYGYTIDQDGKHTGDYVLAISDTWQDLANRAVKMMLANEPNCKNVMDRDIDVLTFRLTTGDMCVLTIQEDVDVLCDL